ncbi:hypothetical protein O7614_01570 [Micromonospora sp. WMMD961]|uniref:hypothetical protein n=1 Tax=Micromonospora sp. WMMD961 TaxID=3016100 RepID=UPI0024172170|nr:hypothetical protein [Micromonospora sp. WMMD961]MDG4778334.1 hypothetical protein [Micromonospora sp. WMMD961]
MTDAVVIPGGRFGPGAPLLMYAGDAAHRRGATVHRHSWSREFPKFDQPEIESWVGGEITPLVDTIGGRPLLIGKSLGANAAAKTTWLYEMAALGTEINRGKCWWSPGDSNP